MIDEIIEQIVKNIEEAEEDFCFYGGNLYDSVLFRGITLRQSCIGGIFKQKYELNAWFDGERIGFKNASEDTLGEIIGIIKANKASAAQDAARRALYSCCGN